MATLATVPAALASSRLRFVATVFTGSFLLFLVQPMIARMALPRLGGAPAVWNSAMLVYQALLLAGYAYAHMLGRLAPRRQGIVHLGLLAAAALTLPIGLSGAMPPPDGNIFLWVPWLLLMSVGPLFLVVSAQAPLMQRWFALSDGGDPYPLYSASNLGSFLGLLSYPLLVEPLIPVASQRWLWSAGYAALFLLASACAWSLPRGLASAEAAPKGPAPSRREIARWIALAAIPSGLMLSTTLHLTTDIVAMPLLWVVPLALYLLSFSIAFATDRRAADAMAKAAPFAVLLSAAGLLALPLPQVAAVLALATLLLVSVGIHRRLFQLRPDASRLTGFYLATSLGGAIGGLFCALIAPLVFDWTYEHPLLLALAGAALAGTQPIARFAGLWSRGAPSRDLALRLGVALLLLSLSGLFLYGGAHPLLALLAPLAIAAIAIAALGRRLLFGAALIALMLSLGLWDKVALSANGRMTRSFFGIYAIGDSAGRARVLMHGTTIHGMELLGSPQRQRQPTAYYVPESGVGLAMLAAPALFPHARIGVVGLGAGTLACYARPDQRWRFYEIDPKVVAIARDARRFHFLAECQPDAPMVLGDARLTLSREPAASADLLVVDAFSSDSVPMHLLTSQAFAVYRRHLAANGLLTVHITNRFLDLRPVIAAAAAVGWTARIRRFVPTDLQRKRDYAAPSIWVALSPLPETIARLEANSGPGIWEPLPPLPGFAPWTDDRASILPIIKWRG